MPALLSTVIVLAGLSLPASVGPDEQSAAGSIPPEVRWVVTGGFWESGDEQGTCRVVVIESGWEFVSCTARVEWLAERPDAGIRVMASSAELDEIPPDTWSLGNPVLEYQAGTSSTLLTIPATGSRSGEERSFSFELAAPGDYSEVRAPGM